MGWERTLKYIRVRVLFVFFIVLFLICTNSYAMPTGNEFLSYNQESKQLYTIGYIDGLNVLSIVFGKNMYPSNVTYAQLLAIVEKYLYTHPEERHLYMTSIFVSAITKAFPNGDGSGLEEIPGYKKK